MSVLLEQNPDRRQWAVPSVQNTLHGESGRLQASHVGRDGQNQGDIQRHQVILKWLLFPFQADKRQKDQAKKQKITENRKHLANVRVVQKNLVFVVGLSPRLADPEILKKPDYFGKFGKIHKVVINHSTQYAGSQLQVITQKRNSDHWNNNVHM